MPYSGVIIEESLKDTSLLQDVKILKTKLETVTEKHKTPWIKQWTLHTVDVQDNQIESVAQVLSGSIDDSHGSWYADLKNDTFHYIIFPNKIFKIERNNPEQYQEATKYGVSVGIPAYQLDFSPQVK